MSKSLLAFPRGVFVGAALMYYLDPARGRRRRARLVDAVTHLQRRERDLLNRAARDASYRVHGVLERARRSPLDQVTSDVLEARVRSHLGRVVSHPSAIEVIADQGRVRLRGPILAHEVRPLLRCVARVPGVHDVVDELEPHATAERIPALQGDPVRRHNDLWTPALQAGALVAGSTLAAWGVLFRRGLIGTAFTLGGGLLALRGAMNVPMSRLVGFMLGREGIEVHKSLIVHAAVEDVFELWSQIENFPRFMEHVKSIEITEQGGSRWTVDGPGGVPMRFETVMTKLEENREVAWETMPDQIVEHSGRVRFDRVPGGTRVDIQMTYRPPAGVVGHVIAHLLRSDPKARIDDDMIRMKALLEDGKTRAHGSRITVEELLH